MMSHRLQGQVPPQSHDETEGTLLLAVHVDDGDAPSAAPIAEFRYHDAAVDLFQQPDEIPTAPLVPKCDNLEERERAESQRLALAKLRGLQQAELEREQLRKADIQTYAINYHTSLKVAEANRIAAERNAKGVGIEKDSWFRHEREKQPKVEKAQDPKALSAFATSADGGYDVAEYQMGEYDTSDDYQFSEYNSVYDK